MTMRFLLGCAIWAYKDWVGDLFPTGSRSGDFLRLYSQRFMAVEGNTTFYSVPDAETLNRWVAETPASFRFCPKLPRDVTHQGALMPMLPKAIAFREQMQRLGSRLGAFFVQLPPTYSPDQFDDLRLFLEHWAQASATAMSIAVEVRHLDWFREPYASQLTTLLKDLNVAKVLLDTRPIYNCPDDPQLDSNRRKPKVPLQPVVTADFSLIRYISHPTLELNQPYLDEWVDRLDSWLNQGTQIYFFVHCPVEARSPGNARYFQQLLEARSLPVEPLPWNQIAPPPTQLSLF